MIHFGTVASGSCLGTRSIWKNTPYTRIRSQRREVYKHSTTCLQLCNLAHEILLRRVWLNISANICRKGRSISNDIYKAQLSISNDICKVNICRTSTDICKGLSSNVSYKHLPQQHARGNNFYGNIRHAQP